MSEKESKKTESEIEQLQDEELDTVAGGLLGITLYDRCSNENPERLYNKSLCTENCPWYELRNDGDVWHGRTRHYCGKVQKIIK